MIRTAEAFEPRSGVPLLLGRTVFLVCLFANVGIVLSLRAYPFVDLPFHLAAATIYRDYHSPSSLFPTYFTIRPLLFEPNILHLLITGLPLNNVASVDTMNRLMLCGYVVSLPLIVGGLIRRIGGNGSFGLLVYPLVFNFNVAWGFVGFVIAIPLVLLALYVLMDCERRPRRAALVCGAMLVLLFYTHVLAMLFTAAVLGLSIFCGAPNRRWGWILLALAPALGLTCWWWLGRGVPSGENMLGFLARYYRTEYFQHFVALRRRVLTNDNTQLFTGAVGVAAALALTTPIVVPALVGLVRNRLRVTSLLADTPRRVLAAFTVVTFACCLLLPDRIPDQTALYERFGVLLMLSMVLWSSVFHTRVSRAVGVGLCIVALCSTVVRVSYFAAFARDAGDFTPELLPDAAPGRTLVGLIYDARFRGHPAYRHFADYYIAWRRGLAATELTQFRFGVVRANPHGTTLPRFDASPNALSFRNQEAHIDYLLVRGTVPPDTGRFVLLRSERDWHVYQNPTR